MTELLAWTFAGTLILAILIAALPVLLWIAGIALVAWIIGKTVESWQAHSRLIDQQIEAVVGRADRQHNLIMAGDEEAGTYGDYLPPPSLR